VWNDYHCNLFIWDDELDSPRVKAMLKKLAAKNSECDGGFSNIGSSSFQNVSSKNDVVGCQSYLVISDYLKQFGKEIGKKIGIEFGKELGKDYMKESVSSKHVKTKQKLQNERKKTSILQFALVLSWVFFVVVLKFM